MGRPNHEIEPVLLHVHSHFSPIDFRLGISSPQKLINQAASNGIKTLSFTDGSLFSYHQNLEIPVNLKLITGVELPADLSGTTMNVSIYARNPDGANFLEELTTSVRLKHKHLNPDELTPRLTDIAVVLRGDDPSAKILDSLIRIPGVYWGLDVPNQAREITDFMESKYGLDKVLLTHRSIAATEADLRLLNVIRRVIPHFKRDCEGTVEPGSVMPTADYLRNNYRDVPQVLKITGEFAGSLDSQPHRYEHIRAKTVPEGMDSFKYLENLAQAKIFDAKLNSFDTRRVNYELTQIQKTGAADALLIALEISGFCRRNNLNYRIAGSANNSFLLYLLGVTDIDARDHYFDRFIHPDRSDLPDVDFHFGDAKDTAKVELFLGQSYGSDKVVHIAKIIHLTREYLQNKISKSGLVFSGQDLELVNNMEPVPWSVGLHPSGVIFDSKLSRRTTGQKGASIVVELDKNDVDDQRILKFDLLTDNGILISNLVEERLKKRGLIPEIPANDPETLQKLTAGRTEAIFMVDTALMNGALQRLGRVVNPEVQHLAQLLALIRSHQKSDSVNLFRRELTDIYFENLSRRSFVLDNPKISGILGKTAGTICYQDQIIHLGEQVAKMSYTEARKLAKTIGDDVKTEATRDLVKKFGLGLLKNGIPAPVVKNIVYQAELTRPATFIEGHAEEMAEIVYREAYYATHFPGEFWVSVLELIAKNGGYLPQAYINAAIASGIEFVFPTATDIYNQNMPELNGNKITLCTGLFRKHQDLHQAYNRFLVLRSEHEKQGLHTPKELENYQRVYFGNCFTHIVERGKK
jgi:DNA polymerase III alpha subunit